MGVGTRIRPLMGPFFSFFFCLFWLVVGPRTCPWIEIKITNFLFLFSFFLLFSRGRENKSSHNTNIIGLPACRAKKE